MMNHNKQNRCNIHISLWRYQTYSFCIVTGNNNNKNHNNNQYNHENDDDDNNNNNINDNNNNKDNFNLEYLDPDLEVPPFNRNITKSIYNTLPNSYFSCDISLLL